MAYIGNPYLNIYMGIGLSKATGEISYENGNNRAVIDFNESDPFKALLGTRIRYGYLQLDGEFSLSDMIKEDGEGPNKSFQAGIGMRF